MIELNNASSGGSLTANAMVQGYGSKIFLDYLFHDRNNQSGGPEYGIPSLVRTKNSDIPFIDKRLRITKADLESLAVVATTDPRFKATGKVAVLRNNSVVREFPFAFTGEGQLRAPTVTASISDNPSAGNPGFATVAGQTFEFTAAYRDASGTTQANVMTVAETDAMMTLGSSVNHVFEASPTVTFVADGVAPTYSIDYSWFNKGTVNTETTFDELTVCATDNVGKQTDPFVIAARTIGRFNNAYGETGFNVQPSFSYVNSGGVPDADMGCEVCFGLIVGANQFVRTSNITTQSPSGTRQFGGGGSQESNGWASYPNAQNNGVPVLVGRDQLLKYGSANVYLKVKAVMFWRPTGQTKWSMTVNHTSNTFPVSSTFNIPANSAFNGTWDSLEFLPNGLVTRTQKVMIGVSVTSKSLGLVGEGPLYLNTYHRPGGGQMSLISVQPEVGQTHPYAYNYTRVNWTAYNYDLGPKPVGATDPNKMLGLITLNKQPNSVSTGSAPCRVESPSGDQYVTVGKRIRVNLSVAADSYATGADWYVRTVTASPFHGSLSKGSWNKIDGTGFTNQWVNTTVTGVILPSTNTTQVRPGQSAGSISWNDASSTQFIIERGDRIMFSAITPTEMTKGAARQLSASGFTNIAESMLLGVHDFNVLTSWNSPPNHEFRIGLPFELLE